MARNPVMFVVEIGSVLTTILFVRDLGVVDRADNLFAGLVAAWLWFTVLFANFAEAVAEGRGKAQADTLRKTRSETGRQRPPADGRSSRGPEPAARSSATSASSSPASSSPATARSSRASPASTSRPSPASRPRSSASRAATARRSPAAPGCCPTRSSCASPRSPGETFLDRMIALVEGAERQKTPNEIALNILLAGLTIIFLLATVTLQPFAIYSGGRADLIVLVALLVCLIPTTIGALLSAIGIAGMDRLVQRNVLAMSRPGRRGGRRLLDAAARQDRHHHLRQPAGGRVPPRRRASTDAELAEAALLSSLADETPEGRSIVDLAEERYGLARAATSPAPSSCRSPPRPACAASTSTAAAIRKGAADSVRRWVDEQGGAVPAELDVDRRRASRATAARRSSWPRAPRVLGVIHLKDVVKPGMGERFDELRRHGHPHGDDHRRQPAHRRGHRRGGRRRRLPRRGHARGQDGADPARSRRAATSSP